MWNEKLRNIFQNVCFRHFLAHFVHFREIFQKFIVSNFKQNLTLGYLYSVDPLRNILYYRFGVQITGQLPSYMTKVSLKKAVKSQVHEKMYSDKIINYKAAIEKYTSGKFLSISSLLTQAKAKKNFKETNGVIVR